MKIPLIRALLMLISFLSIAGFGRLAATAQTRPVPNPQLASKEVNARVDALLKKMTLDEKVGQLAQYVVGAGAGPGDSSLSYEEMVAKGLVGSLTGVNDAEAANHYQHIAVEKSRLHIPILFART
jgi:beta-glucosidase